MKNLQGLDYMSYHICPLTYRSSGETQCIVHHLMRHSSVTRGNIMPPKRSSRIVVSSNQTTRYTNVPIERMGSGAKEDFHVDELSRVPRVNGEKVLPKFIEPFGLHDFLQNPLAQGESLRARICNFADSLVTSFLTPSELKPSLDPSVLLSGVVAPACETDPTDCRITYGRIPDDLDGVYLRNGPNAALMHRGDGIHFFEGDGMIHAVRMRNGTASFCSRFVQTSRFRQERAAGRPLFPKILGGMHGLSGVARGLIMFLRVALGLLDVSHGIGVSNTNVIFFNGHILSLSPEDMPYILRVTDDGDIVTVDQFKLPSRFNMCSHPKIDPVSGDMYAHSLQFWFPIHYSVFRVPADDGGMNSSSSSGNVCVPLLEVPVPLLNVPLVHDFAITERFIIFPDDQIVFRVGDITKRETPLGCDANKTGRFCLLPRLDGSDGPQPQWFEAPGINCLHYINAWEEGDDEVVLMASDISLVESFSDFPLNSKFSLLEIRFNTREGSVKPRTICLGLDMEYGVFNQTYIGRKTRYAYCAVRSNLLFTSLVKLDLMHLEEGSGGHECIVGTREFGEGKYVGEPWFVEAKGASSEDHGYLLCIVGDMKGGVSELWVMDALTATLEVVAVVELPVRVPLGFHGCFVNEEQLAQQKS